MPVTAFRSALNSSSFGEFSRTNMFKGAYGFMPNSSGSGAVLQTQDSSENTYLITYNSGAAGTTGTYVVIFKIDSTGTLQWQKRVMSDYVNAGNYAYPSGAGTDSSGNLYVLLRGNTSGGTDCMILLKVTSAGALSWSRNFGGSLGGLYGSATDNGLAVDTNGNCYATYFNQYTWVTKYDTNGTYQWNVSSTTSATNKYTYSNGIQTDGSGCYVAMYTYNTSAGRQAEIVKYNTAGSESWRKSFVDTNLTSANQNSYFTCIASNTQAGMGGVQWGMYSSGRGFFGSLDSSGAVSFKKKWATTGTYPVSIATDNNGNYIYVGGYTDDTTGGNYFLMRTGTTGTVAWTNKIGSPTSINGSMGSDRSNLWIYLSMYSKGRYGIVKVPVDGSLTNSTPYITGSYFSFYYNNLSSNMPAQSDANTLTISTGITSNQGGNAGNGTSAWTIATNSDPYDVIV